MNLPGVGQRGMAMVSALLLLLVVSLLAVGLSMDSSMDVRVAGYQRLSARSFGFTEAGLLSAADILEENVAVGGKWTDGDELPNKSASYQGLITVLLGDFGMLLNAGAVPVLRMTGDINADIVIQRLTEMLSEGNAIQVAAGYSGGAGKASAAGGVNVIYDVAARGGDFVAGETLASKNLGFSYRYITGTK